MWIVDYYSKHLGNHRFLGPQQLCIENMFYTDRNGGRDFCG